MSDIADPPDLFAGMFGARPGGRDWLAALLSVEAALAVANAKTDRIPADAAELIAAHCRPELFDLASLADRTARHATPVRPLVDDLRAALPAAVAGYVHTPATSQDIIDTALMLLSAGILDAALADLGGCAAELETLAVRHRTTPLMGRTLLTPALPTTLGRLVRTWAAGLARGMRALTDVRRSGLAVQLGGPVGDLDAPDLVAAFAAELGLVVPAAGWHTERGRVAELAAAAGLVTGALAKIAGDVLLLAQPEVGMLAEGEPGGSSAMPDKRNSARSVQMIACAHRVPGLVSTVFAGLPQELHRAAGRWQAEWETVTDLLTLTAAAAGHGRIMLTGLRVPADHTGA